MRIGTTTGGVGSSLIFDRFRSYFDAFADSQGYML
jgi:hypothetical protein